MGGLDSSSGAPRQARETPSIRSTVWTPPFCRRLVTGYDHGHLPRRVCNRQNREREMPRSAAGGLARESRSEREGRGVQVRKVGQRSHGRPFRTVRTTFRTVRTTYWIDVQTACANGPPWPGTTWARQGVPRAYWTLLDAIRRNRTR